MRLRSILIASMALAAPGVVIADDAPLIDDTEVAACQVVKTRIAKLYLPSGQPDRYWFCDFASIDNEYLRIVALRSSRPRDDGATIYSNLVGWFAVGRRSTVVLAWDVGESRVIPLPSASDIAKAAASRESNTLSPRR